MWILTAQLMFAPYTVILFSIEINFTNKTKFDLFKGTFGIIYRPKCERFDSPRLQILRDTQEHCSKSTGSKDPEAAHSRRCGLLHFYSQIHFALLAFSPFR